jgi:hypothetical protein
VCALETGFSILHITSYRSKRSRGSILERRVATNERKVILTAPEAADYLRVSLFTLNRIERRESRAPLLPVSLCTLSRIA